MEIVEDKFKYLLIVDLFQQSFELFFESRSCPDLREEEETH